MEKRPKKHPKKHGHRTRTRTRTEDKIHIKINLLFNDFFDMLENAPQPEEAFDTGSQEYRLAMLWLNKLVAMQCHTVLDGEIRNAYMGQLSACISQRRLYGIFEQMPPDRLEWMEFRDIAQQTVQRTTMRDTDHSMRSQSKERPEQLTTPRQQPTSRQPFDMQRESAIESMGGAQQHMGQAMDESLDIESLNHGQRYESTTSLEPSEMTRDCGNQSLGGSQRHAEDTSDEAVQYFDPSLASPSSNDSSCSMESRAFNQCMDRAQHLWEPTVQEPQQRCDPRACAPTTFSRRPMQDTMDANITYFDASLSSRSPHTGSGNMERRALNHSMDRAQHYMAQGTSRPATSSRLEPSDMRCPFVDQSMGAYGDQLQQEDAMGERSTMPDSSLSSPLSHEAGPSNMPNRDDNQSLGGDQQPLENAMDGSVAAPASMECRAFKQSLGAAQQHMEQTVDEPGRHFYQSDAYAISSTSMEPCEMTHRSISQSMAGEQQPMEGIPFFNPYLSDADPCDMEYPVLDQPAGGDACRLEDDMNEDVQIFEPALSASLSEENTRTVEYRDIDQSMGGDQHPMDAMGKRGEGITFFDPSLSPPSPIEELSDIELQPSFWWYTSRGLHLPETTMGGGAQQFNATTKDNAEMPQRHDAVQPAGIEEPMVSAQNVIEETLLGIRKIFKAANGAPQRLCDPKPALGSHPVGQSGMGMGKFSFNQSLGGPQQLMQRLLGGAEQGDEQTKGAAQQLQKSPLESAAEMVLYPRGSMRRGISRSVSCPQIVMLTTMDEAPKCHVNTKLEAQKLEKASGSGLGPGPGPGLGPVKMQQHFLPMERPKLLRHKTMDVAQPGDKGSKTDAPTFECPGPSGMGSYLWDSMGRALGKSFSGLQMLMKNGRNESVNGHEQIESGIPKINAVINGDSVTSEMVGRRHFGCLSCLEASPKWNRQAPVRSHEAASAGPAATARKETCTHRPEEQRKDLFHILESVQGELRGEATVGHDDCLEKEMLRYRDFLIEANERKLKQIMRSGSATAERRYLLESMQKDLLHLLK